MVTFDEHRRRLSAWKRVLVVTPVFALFLAPYLFQRRSPAAFWTAVVVLGLFGAWAAGRAGWHYWVLLGED